MRLIRPTLFFSYIGPFHFGARRIRTQSLQIWSTDLFLVFHFPRKRVKFPGFTKNAGKFTKFLHDFEHWFPMIRAVRARFFLFCCRWSHQKGRQHQRWQQRFSLRPQQVRGQLISCSASRSKFCLNLFNSIWLSITLAESIGDKGLAHLQRGLSASVAPLGHSWASLGCGAEPTTLLWAHCSSWRASQVGKTPIPKVVLGLWACKVPNHQSNGSSQNYSTRNFGTWVSSALMYEHFCWVEQKRRPGAGLELVVIITSSCTGCP